MDDNHVHVCESKAEPELAANEHEMWCTGFAQTNCGVASGRKTFESEDSYRVNGLLPERIWWAG